MHIYTDPQVMHGMFVFFTSIAIMLLIHVLAKFVTHAILIYQSDWVQYKRELDRALQELSLWRQQHPTTPLSLSKEATRLHLACVWAYWQCKINNTFYDPTGEEKLLIDSLEEPIEKPSCK